MSEVAMETSPHPQCRWCDDKIKKEELEHVCRYPREFTNILRIADAAKLVELHRQKGMAYAEAFDARALQNEFDPDGNMTDIQKADVEYDIETWEDEDPENTVTRHLIRWQELYGQIKAILDTYQYQWWDVSVGNRAAADH